MKKKLFALFMVLALAMALMAACGGSGSSEPEAEPVSADPVEVRQVYVSPQWVKSVVDNNQEGYEDYVIAEVAYPDTTDKYEDYGKGHIPGAIYVSIQEVEDATGDEAGAYNLLDAAKVRDYLLSHGITKDTKVILYGADPCGVGRQAYGYLWCGVEDVKILDGGKAAWESAGYELETEEAKARDAATDFGAEVPVHPEYWTSIDDAKDKVASDEHFKLVSIRSEDEWLGKTSGYSYMDKAGEPEGAVWGKGADTAFDVAQFLHEDGTIKSLDEFKEIWKDCDFNIDEDHLAFYCGTGWRACPPFLVLYQNGYDNISVYDGGWYEWLFHDDYPVQVGDPASDDCVHTTVGQLETGKALKEE